MIVKPYYVRVLTKKKMQGARRAKIRRKLFIKITNVSMSKLFVKTTFSAPQIKKKLALQRTQDFRIS